MYHIKCEISMTRCVYFMLVFEGCLFSPGKQHNQKTCCPELACLNKGIIGHPDLLHLFLG